MIIIGYFIKNQIYKLWSANQTYSTQDTTVSVLQIDNFSNFKLSNSSNVSLALILDEFS